MTDSVNPGPGRSIKTGRPREAQERSYLCPRNRYDPRYELAPLSSEASGSERRSDFSPALPASGAVVSGVSIGVNEEGCAMEPSSGTVPLTGISPRSAVPLRPLR